VIDRPTSNGRGWLVAAVLLLTLAMGGVGCAMLVRSSGQGRVHATQVLLKETERDMVRQRMVAGSYLQDLESRPVDGWGHPIRIEVPGPQGHPYQLLSYGADGLPGGRGPDADICNWEF
jgi:hypothetical protein